MSNEQQFQPGEIVDVTIKGVRIAPLATGEIRNIRIVDGEGHKFAVPPQAMIARIAPAEWPPQVRDLWQDGAGDLWFAFEDYDQENDSFVNLRCSVAKSTQGWGPTIDYYVNDEHGPMTLVRREGWSPAGPDDAAVDDLARDLFSADVEINGGNYPRWCDLHDSGQEQYRKAARFLLVRHRVVPREQQDGGAQ